MKNRKKVVDSRSHKLVHNRISGNVIFGATVCCIKFLYSSNEGKKNIGREDHRNEKFFTFYVVG